MKAVKAYAFIALLILCAAAIGFLAKAQGDFTPPAVHDNDNWSPFIADVCIIDGIPQIFSVNPYDTRSITYMNNKGEVWSLYLYVSIGGGAPYVRYRIYLGGESEGYRCWQAFSRG